MNADIKAELEAKHFLKPMPGTKPPYVPPTLTGYRARLEIGSKDGKCHSHALIEFNGPTYIDLPAITAFAKVKSGGIVKYLNNTYYRDVAKAMEMYIDKQDNVDHVEDAKAEKPAKKDKGNIAT